MVVVTTSCLSWMGWAPSFTRYADIEYDCPGSGEGGEASMTNWPGSVAAWLPRWTSTSGVVSKPGGVEPVSALEALATERPITNAWAGLAEPPPPEAAASATDLALIAPACPVRAAVLLGSSARASS